MLCTVTEYGTILPHRSRYRPQTGPFQSHKAGKISEAYLPVTGNSPPHPLMQKSGIPPATPEAGSEVRWSGPKGNRKEGPLPGGWIAGKLLDQSFRQNDVFPAASGKFVQHFNSLIIIQLIKIEIIGKRYHKIHLSKHTKKIMPSAIIQTA